MTEKDKSLLEELGITMAEIHCSQTKLSEVIVEFRANENTNRGLYCIDAMIILCEDIIKKIDYASIVLNELFKEAVVELKDFTDMINDLYEMRINNEKIVNESKQLILMSQI